ncbi:hypothetical protein H4W33_010490 [Kibdelosporangium phytohabitans]|uniref:Uncharacterized protein n=1 Tax=Kibdelosporangium phytohabitans TaxID=860235 RepID=A0A0N9HZH2_9PSEU|nr:hypothetical protein [Kibdelosporangium phytohabitans]ALG07632.1 hypothetical protein AOZ06_12590 [Kibdelosporangium phytohabitans]ALG07688.1 hypothetical protein AOZ06_12910 [Kibdelosporangium phytohabitans]MBE1471416.1 hypothetical protein [Kibdelosporangium phytohabitans]
MSADGWTFESTITDPNGVRVTVTVSVPLERAWKDVGESAELAQMAASRAQAMLRDSRERAPF